MTQDAVSLSESCVAALLSWSLISTRSTPLCYGSLVIEPPLIVTGWCPSGPTGAECLAVPRRGHHVGDHGSPGFSNGFTAKVTMFTTIQGLGCGRNGRLAGMRADEEGGALSRMRQTARGGRYDLTVGTLQRLATASACGEQE
jgi:hypothetical protein